MENATSSVTNNYDFILWLVSNLLSWQVTTIVIVCILRTPITRLLKRIKYVRFNKIVVSLTKDIDRTNKQSEIVKLKKLSKYNEKTLFMKRVLSIAEISPISVIIFTYYQIENIFVNAYEYVDDEYKPKIIDKYTLDFYKNGLITEQEYDLFKDMTSIFNTVLDNKDKAKYLKKKTAIKYGKTAEKLIDRINELKDNAPST